MKYPLETAVFLSLYFGLPIGTVLLDRYRRRKRSGAEASKEPALLAVVGWTMVVYPAGLAYYFENTRGTRLARYAGFGLGILYALVSLGGMILVMLPGMTR